ncbi:fibronectin type III domain-containing protein [Candidatus Azambacteria bacterium]|nr:fibronectin type III domain-containing protein [Candidatus Azambacteria bacterium]
MKTLAVFLVLFFVWFGECLANQAAIGWEPPWLNTDGTPCTDLAGYRIFMGTAGGTYLKTFDVGMGNETFIPCTTNPTAGCVKREFTISGLTPDSTYYFVATAYNTSGNESAYSNEVSKMISSDTTQPQDVMGFAISSTFAGGSGWARLSWTNPPDADLAQVIIEYSYNSGPMTHLANLTAVPGMAQTYDHANLMAGSYTYAIHTRDTSGNMTHTAMASTFIEDPASPVKASAPSGGGGGGCFIATAAYGSYLDPHVITLRKFRDEYLLTNLPGRAFVAAYYWASPPIADFITKHEWARETTQVALAPIVFTVLRPLEAMIFFALLTLISIAVVFVLKRMP